MEERKKGRTAFYEQQGEYILLLFYMFFYLKMPVLSSYICVFPVIPRQIGSHLKPSGEVYPSAFLRLVYTTELGEQP